MYKIILQHYNLSGYNLCAVYIINLLNANYKFRDSSPNANVQRVDSTSALQALSNYNENNCLRVQNCRELLGEIKGKIVFQWVPSHCGLWGNERADFLAKKGTGILQNFRRDLTLHSAKLEIKRIFRESFRLATSRVARDKPWM
ncbi:hypothetical protein TNCV_3351601 [Trichonephila clavipes]|nr:hypothetical protein TNCV_3351601 [Trichonephila clavipes]